MVLVTRSKITTKFLWDFEMLYFVIQEFESLRHPVIETLPWYPHRTETG